MTTESRHAEGHGRSAIEDLRYLATNGVSPTSLQGCVAFAKIILTELAVPAVALGQTDHGLAGWQGALIEDVLARVTAEQQEIAFNRRDEIRKSRRVDDCFKVAAAGELLGLSDEAQFIQLRTGLEKVFGWRWEVLVEKDDNRGERNHRRLRASLWLAAASAKTGERHEKTCLLALLSAIKVYLARPEVAETLRGQYERYWSLPASRPQPAPSSVTYAPQPAESAPTPVNSRRWSRKRTLLVALLVVGVVSGSVTAGKLLADANSTPQEANEGGQVVDDELPSVTTDYEVAFTYGAGVYTYAGPSRDHTLGTPLPDGEVLRIVCQDRHGEVMTAEEWADGDDSPRYDEDWPVWNKLDNEYWIPDLFVNTPKIPGNEPPDGIPLCEN